jgi:hypothetical protein
VQPGGHGGEARDVGALGDRPRGVARAEADREQAGRPAARDRERARERGGSLEVGHLARGGLPLARRALRGAVTAEVERHGGEAPRGELPGVAVGHLLLHGGPGARHDDHREGATGDVPGREEDVRRERVALAHEPDVVEAGAEGGCGRGRPLGVGRRGNGGETGEDEAGGERPGEARADHGGGSSRCGGDRDGGWRRRRRHARIWVWSGGRSCTNPAARVVRSCCVGLLLGPVQRGTR